MKQNKGITLISLVVYIIGMVVIIAMVGSLLSFYNNNMVKMNDTSDVNMELSKFTARMIAETKEAGNEISEVTGSTIKFKNGNVYTYQDNRIYENTMVVSQYVKDYLASLEVDGSKQILRIHIVLQKGETETTNNLTYVIEEAKGQVAMGPTYVINNAGDITVSAKQGKVSITEGESKDIAQYFTYTTNGNLPMSSIRYTNVSKNDAEINNTNTLTIGTYEIKCTVTNAKGVSASETMTLTVLPDVNNIGLANRNVTLKPNENSNLQIVIPKGFGIAVLEGSGTTTSLPGQSGKVIGIMAKEEWQNITIEQINKGIVIVDHAITYTQGVPDFNEYVWVPIPESSKFARVAWTTLYGRDAFGIWVAGTGVTHSLADKSVANKFWEDTTTTEYTHMVTSVSRNNGFYIGRYETSINDTIIQSKRNQPVKVEISQIDAITACTSNTSRDNMHLMYGIEWDSTLNWLKDNAIIASSTAGRYGIEGTTKIMQLADIQTNCNTWGNYKNSVGNAATGKGALQNTGFSEYWKANNIYDLAGNVWEWTQEKYSTGSDCAYRGGVYGFDGEYMPVAYRYGRNADYMPYDGRFQS